MTTYQVLARKWRPRSFDAVVGQDAITRTLRNALVSGRIAHAYLFTGPRGVGKTTTARLLARALLCPARTGAEPCGACPACVEAQAGAAVDVLEIDAASNRGIDEIRTLRENVKYAPSRGQYKVYIIDEMHQLTGPAFDAFLKTLEEPPPHVVFVLATTDPRKIPATVLSRVQRFDFRPIAPEVLTATLEGILREEGIPCEAGALPIVVRAAEGSLRDALSLLDTAIAYGGGRLEAATVATLLGASAPEQVLAFATALVARETAAALEAVDRAVADGEDLQAFVRDVVEVLRRVLVLKAAPTAKVAGLTPLEGNELRRLGEASSLDEILYVLRAFLEADATMRDSPHPRVELEMAAVRATRRPAPQAIDDLLRRIDEAEARLREVGTASVAAPAPAGPLQERLPAAPAAVPPLRGERAASAPAAPPVDARAAAGAPPAPAAPAADLETAWPLILDEVMRKKPMLGSVLAQARPGGIDRGQLSVVVGGNHFHRDLLADAASRDLLVRAAQRYLRGVERVEVVAEGGGAGDVRSHPAVQAVIDEFQGEVVAVRPRSPAGGEP